MAGMVAQASCLIVLLSPHPQLSGCFLGAANGIINVVVPASIAKHFGREHNGSISGLAQCAPPRWPS